MAAQHLYSELYSLRTTCFASLEQSLEQLEKSSLDLNDVFLRHFGSGCLRNLSSEKRLCLSPEEEELYCLHLRVDELCSLALEVWSLSLKVGELFCSSQETGELLDSPVESKEQLSSSMETGELLGSSTEVGGLPCSFLEPKEQLGRLESCFAHLWSPKDRFSCPW